MSDEKTQADSVEPSFTADSSKEAMSDVPADPSGKKLRWAFRKVDVTLLFVVFISNVLNSMDRANLGMAK
ncbi:hypothetical protein GGH98_001902, partial [Coemansia sp. RSA 454]